MTRGTVVIWGQRRIKMVWIFLGIGTRCWQECMDPRAAGKVAMGTGCKEWSKQDGIRGVGWTTEEKSHPVTMAATL